MNTEINKYGIPYVPRPALPSTYPATHNVRNETKLQRMGFSDGSEAYVQVTHTVSTLKHSQRSKYKPHQNGGMKASTLN